MTIKKISAKQLKVLTWWCDSSPHRDLDAVICDGAVRSGKTLFMSISFIFWAMHQFSGQQFGICGKTINSLRRNVVSVLLPLLRGFGFNYEYKLSRNLFTVRMGNRENTFHLFGGYDESSAALIQGVTFAGILMDEVALMPRSFVEQACARCSVSGSKLWFNCNPEGPYHWFYLEWITKAEERCALYLHFTMDDNPALTQKIRDRYKRLYSGVFYQRFVLGEWVVAQGRIYDFFDDSYIAEPPKGEFNSYYISCDYGTANPASFGLWGNQRGIWYRIEEYYFDSRREGTQKTDAEYVSAIRRLAAGREIRAVVVDPSAASFIESLHREGIPAIKAVNDVVTGIRITADLLKKREIVICGACKDAIREFSLYVWDEKSGGDAPVKKNDHAMDDIRYFAATIVAVKEDNFAVTAVER